MGLAAGGSLLGLVALPVGEDGLHKGGWWTKQDTHFASFLPLSLARELEYPPFSSKLCILCAFFLLLQLLIHSLLYFAV